MKPKLFGLDVFNAIAELAVGARRRSKQEHQDFLSFFREVVATVPAEVVETFGHMSGVQCVHPNGEIKSYGILLTATDYMFWKQKIEIEGIRFVKGAASVQMDMLDRLSTQAEMQRLSPAERTALIEMMERAQVSN